MTPADITAARAALGPMWGKSRPLLASELGRALGMTGRDTGRSILQWERGEATPHPAAIIAIRAMLAGYRPEGTGQ